MTYSHRRLAGIGGIYIVIVGSLPPTVVPNFLLSHDGHRLVLFVAALGFLVINFLLSMEAVFAYAILGDYAMSFHMLSPASEKWSGATPLLVELKVIVGKVITTLWSGAVATYVGHVGFGALTGHGIGALDSRNAVSWMPLLWQSLYFATTTFAMGGYGDITPANVYGQLVSLLLELQAFAIISIVVTSLFAARERGRVA